jgi:hypothetical protein
MDLSLHLCELQKTAIDCTMRRSPAGTLYKVHLPSITSAIHLAPTGVRSASATLLTNRGIELVLLTPTIAPEASCTEAPGAKLTVGTPVIRHTAGNRHGICRGALDGYWSATGVLVLGNGLARVHNRANSK